MKKYLKINDKMIIREEDKMLFSAKNMKIYKFNKKGFEVIKIINNSSKITEDELFLLIQEDYIKEEFINLMNKMIDNKIVVFYEE